MSKEGMRYINQVLGKKARERGNQSEYRVDQALRRRPDVETVIPTQPFDPRDRKGTDLVAIFKNGEEVKVQVKSSRHAMIDFVAKRKEKWGFPTDRAVEQEFMMVNGQDPHAVIDTSIDNQVESMGIVHEERKFGDIKQGEVVQLFPPPRQLKRAA